MNNKIWILVIVIVIIVVIYFIVKKNKTTEIPNAVTNLVNNSGLGNIISSPNSSGTSNTTVVIKTDNYKIGDRIYSKDTTNTYKSASASSSNLDSFKSFGKDELIGTYLAKDGVFLKVLIANPAHSVFVLSNQVYSK